MSKQGFSCTVLVFMLMCFEEATSVNYHLDVTIVNSYGNVVKILTNSLTHPSFTIPIGGRYQINITTSVNVPVYITSFDNETLKAIKTNGENSLFVTPTVTKEKLVYYVPSAPKQNSSTKAPAVSSTDAMSTTTDPVVSSPGFAVTTNNPSNADMTTDESSDVASTESTFNNATTQGLTMAVASTKRSTNAAVSQPSTNAAVTQLPTTNVSTKVPTNIVIITQDSTTNASTKNPTDNVKNQLGPTNSTNANKDVNKDECKEEKKYIVAIIVLAILLVILLIIVVCLVIYRATKNGKTKTGILYETPKEDMDEGETRF